MRQKTSKKIEMSWLRQRKCKFLNEIERIRVRS